jgi:hypothetical protein
MFPNSNHFSREYPKRKETIKQSSQWQERKSLASVYFVLSKNELYHEDRADIRERKHKRLQERVFNGLHA